METLFITIENSKMNEPHKSILNLSQRLDLRSWNKHFALQSLFVYYTWKNIRKQCKNNKLKIIARTWNDEFELTVPIHFYLNKINIRLVFKIKDGYNL